MFLDGLRTLPMAFERFRTAFGRLLVIVDGFSLSWMAFRYRGRLFAIVDGFAPTTHIRFLNPFFFRCEAPPPKMHEITE